MKVVVIGTGYVGLVTGTCLAEIGHEVVCVDVDVNKIKTLRDGRSPIFEPGLDAMIQHNLSHRRLSFETDVTKTLTHADVAFIAVGTPEGEDGSADLRYVLDVARAIGESARRSLMVIVKSTVPVGTCDLVEQMINESLKKRSASFSIQVASNPEFLKEGVAIDDFMKPDRIVVGVNDDSYRPLFEDLYRPFIIDDPAKLFVTSRRSSELTKYAANAMLATRISFMNELATLCSKVGANIDHVRLGIGSDPRIGKKFLYAGPGYGGSCFPKDVAALLKTGTQYGVHLGVLAAVEEANRSQKQRVATIIKERFGSLSDVRIGIWGLAFKPNTDDVRETPAETVIRFLISEGATILAHDPQASKRFAKMFGEHPRLLYCNDAYDCAQNSDGLVLITEWAEYRRPDWTRLASSMRQRNIFDFRNQYDAQTVMKSGFYYRCMGRPDSTSRPLI